MRLRGDEEDVLGPSEGSGAGFSADRLLAPPSQITGTRAHGATGCIPWGIQGSDFSLVNTIGHIYWYFLDSDLCLAACPAVWSEDGSCSLTVKQGCAVYLQE